MDERIESFLAQYQEVLTTMQPEELETNVTAVIETLLEKPKSLQKETNVFLGEINSGSYLFNRNIKEADFLRTVKLEDVQRFYSVFISPQSPTRTKISAQFYGANCPLPSGSEPVNEATVLIKNATQFKRDMSLTATRSNIDAFAVVGVDEC